MQLSDASLRKRTNVLPARRARRLAWGAGKRQLGLVGARSWWSRRPHRGPGTDQTCWRRPTVLRTHPLAFPIRLPDALQAEALRLLDASREAINQLLLELWPVLDRFAAERTGPAWKQVERYATRRSGHGSRQERGEMEQAGRILRAQASRKQVFLTILPLLSAGLIRPAEGKRPAKKDYRLIREQVRALRAAQQEAGEEADAYLAMTNLLEQACNHYLETGAFPTTTRNCRPSRFKRWAS